MAIGKLSEKSETRFFGMVSIFGVILAISIIGAVCIGVVPVETSEVIKIFRQEMFGWTAEGVINAHADIIWDLRFPRVLMAAIAGAGLALCGTIMQASVQNPLAEPYILGIASGASFGAVISILFGSTQIMAGMGTAFWAFVGAVIAMLSVLALAGRGGRISTVKLVLAGAVLSALMTAGANFVVYIANDAEGMRTAAFWSMGSLAGAKWDSLLLPAGGVIVAVIYFLTQSHSLNAFLMGEEAAVTLGVDIVKKRRVYMIVTALVTGVIVASCGIFGFVGLVIPHAMRSIVGNDHRKLLPAVIIAGALFLIWADVLSRVILPSGELPLGIITALIGAPLFMKLLFRDKFNFGDN